MQQWHTCWLKHTPLDAVSVGYNCYFLELSCRIHVRWAVFGVVTLLHLVSDVTETEGDQWSTGIAPCFLSDRHHHHHHHHHHHVNHNSKLLTGAKFSPIPDCWWD